MPPISTFELILSYLFDDPYPEFDKEDGRQRYNVNNANYNFTGELIIHINMEFEVSDLSTCGRAECRLWLERNGRTLNISLQSFERKALSVSLGHK